MSSLVLKGRILSLSVFFCLLSCQSLHPTDNAEQNTEEMISAQLSLVKNLLERQDYFRALSDISELSKTHPENDDVLNMQGLVHLSMNNNIKAIEVLEKAFSLSSEKPAIGLNLSSSYLAAGKNAKARDLLLALLKKDYDRKDRIWQNLGVAYEKLGTYNQAEASFKKALEENPIYYMPCVSLARLSGKQGQAEKQLEYLKKAIHFCPICFEPVESLAQFYLKRADLKKAQGLLREYLTRDGVTRADLARAKSLLKKKLG